jgi:hypothetical protein
MGATARIAALAAILVVAPACQRSEASEATSICGDLTNLRATVAHLEAPSGDATVGEVRGDIEKLDSTVGAVTGSSAVPDAVGKSLEDARDDYRDVFDGVGDDDPFSSYASQAADPARRLGTAYDEVVSVLGCGRTPSPTVAS